MLQKLVSRNEDLSHLRADGLDVSIGTSKHLLIRDVPYVTPSKEIRRGIIASVLDLAGERTAPPETHVVFFVGECPCDINGSPLPGVSQNTNQPLGEGLMPNHQISRVPKTGPNPGKYPDYYAKITSLVNIVWHPARALDSTVTPYTNPVLVPDDDSSLFNYLDTAATKSGIVVANAKLEQGKIAIIGLGGTGSYVLDFVAKTPIAELHLFDGDIFLNHNALRSPGASSLDDLNKKQQKVHYFAELYAHMRKNVIPHDGFVDEQSLDQLKDMSFVFICIDKGPAKRLIIEKLVEWRIPFINVGISIQLGDDNTLGGHLAITTGTADMHNHVPTRIGFGDGEAPNEYSRDVNIAEINALAAALAVVKWKKLRGYYDDTTKEHYCAYTIRTNYLISENTHET